MSRDNPHSHLPPSPKAPMRSSSCGQLKAGGKKSPSQMRVNAREGGKVKLWHTCSIRRPWILVRREPGVRERQLEGTAGFAIRDKHTFQHLLALDRTCEWGLVDHARPCCIYALPVPCEQVDHERCGWGMTPVVPATVMTVGMDSKGKMSRQGSQTHSVCNADSSARPDESWSGAGILCTWQSSNTITRNKLSRSAKTRFPKW